MGLEIYYPSDIRNAILAAEQATSAAIQAVGPDNAFGMGFLAGYHAALTTLALAFGLIQVEKNNGEGKGGANLKNLQIT